MHSPLVDALSTRTCHEGFFLANFCSETTEASHRLVATCLCIAADVSKKCRLLNYATGIDCFRFTKAWLGGHLFSYSILTTLANHFFSILLCIGDEVVDVHIEDDAVEGVNVSVSGCRG